MHSFKAFTLIECLLAVSIAAILFLGTLSAINFVRVSNELEQERTRANQIVRQELEKKRMQLITEIAAVPVQTTQTIWDHGTADDATDDTVGTLEVEARDYSTGAVLAASDQLSKMAVIEATLTWHPRGRLGKKTMRESVMTSVTP